MVLKGDYKNMINNERLSGILLHPTSLPSPYGIGDLGDEAYAFIDFLPYVHQFTPGTGMRHYIYSISGSLRLCIL